MSNSALSGCATFLCPVWDQGLYPNPIGLRLVGWIFSRLADQNHPLRFFGSKSLRPSQPGWTIIWSRFWWKHSKLKSYHWNHTSDPKSRCKARRSPGSTWRSNCFLLGFQLRRHPCSTRGRCYVLPASQHAWSPIQGHFHCRSSYDLCRWIFWDLQEI